MCEPLDSENVDVLPMYYRHVQPVLTTGLTKAMSCGIMCNNACKTFLAICHNSGRSLSLYIPYELNMDVNKVNII